MPHFWLASPEVGILVFQAVPETPAAKAALFLCAFSAINQSERKSER